MNDENLMNSYSAVEVAIEAGITFRVLDYWDRTGYLHPSIQPAEGSGSRRLYSDADLEKARLTKQLLDMGISMQRLREDGDPTKTWKSLAKDLKGR